MKRMGVLLFVASAAVAEGADKPASLGTAPKAGAVQIPPALKSEADQYRNARAGLTGGLDAARAKYAQSEKTRIDAKIGSVRARMGSTPAGSPPPTCPKPTIKSVLADAPVSPGEIVVLNGCGFGSGPGHVRLMGQFPGGFLELVVQPPWRDNSLEVKVPDVSGVRDNASRITVLRSDNTIGNELPLPFQATRVVHQLPRSLAVVGCAQAGDCNIDRGSHPGDHGFQWVDPVRVPRHRPGGGLEPDRHPPGEPARRLHALLLRFSSWAVKGANSAGIAYAKPPTGFSEGARSATLSVQTVMFGDAGVCLHPRRLRAPAQVRNASQLASESSVL